MHYSWDKPMILIRRNLWLRRRRLAMFGLKKSDRILDLGCGDGLDIQILHGWGFTHLVGVDISSKLLTAAKKRISGVRFICASADNLPFQDGAFTVVLADSVLYHLVGNTKAVKEIQRVLVRGGILCFIDMHMSWKRTLFNALTFSSANQIIPYLRKRKNAYLAEKQAIERWQKGQKDFLHMLENSGFQKVYTRIHGLSLIGQYQRI